MNKRYFKSAIISTVLFSGAIVGLAFMPHYSCACGRYEDSSQLTHFVNSVSEKIIGKPLIEKNKNPLKNE